MTHGNGPTHPRVNSNTPAMTVRSVRFVVAQPQEVPAVHEPAAVGAQELPMGPTRVHTRGRSLVHEAVITAHGHRPAAALPHARYHPVRGKQSGHSGRMSRSQPGRGLVYTGARVRVNCTNQQCKHNRHGSRRTRREGTARGRRHQPHGKQALGTELGYSHAPISRDFSETIEQTGSNTLRPRAFRGRSGPGNPRRTLPETRFQHVTGRDPVWAWTLPIHSPRALLTMIG